MKLKLLSLSLTVTLFFSVISCNKTAEDKITLTPETEARNVPLADDYMFKQRAFPFGKVKPSALTDAMAWRNTQMRQNNFTSTAVWQQIGPLNVGGRITDIEIPVNNADTYYVGAASGGIFKTTDAGKTWNPIFDDQPFLSIGDIDISKKNPNTLWVGIGEPNSAGDTMMYDGEGIYYSNDAGATWQSKGLKNIASVGKVIIDPNDDNTIFVGAAGHLYKPSNERGVYRSKDNGKTWKKVLFINNTTGVIDMAIHPTNSNIIYAAAWDRIRTVGNPSRFGGEGTNMYRSTDGGDTWKILTRGLPSNADDKGRIGFDISQSNPKVLYARYADAKGTVQGIYKTTDGGDSWNSIGSSQIADAGFHWWFSGIFIDPKDENTLYNVDFRVQKSTDGGKNWSRSFSKAHVDMHALAFNAKKPGHVLLGCDGGVYTSNDGGSNITKFENIPLMQFYKIYVNPKDPNHIMGGTQDNSTPGTRNGGKSNWRVMHSGDGFQPLIDPVNEILYAQSQGGMLVKSNYKGIIWSNCTSGVSGRRNWDSPVIFDPKDFKTLYFGSNKVYKTTNSAGSWTAISPDLSNGGGASKGYGTVFTIDVSQIDSNIIYAGTDDGNVWVTKNGGSNWKKVSEKLPKRWITQVYADPKDKATAYVTLSGHFYSEFKGHIFKTTNYGETWEAIGKSLPDCPINDVKKDKRGNLYIGTDIGVFGSSNEGKSWQIVGSNLPPVKVADLQILDDKVLYAGTFGRSIYKVDITGNILSVDNNELAATISMFPNPASSQVSFTLKETSKQLNITIYDALGRSVISKSLTNTKTATIPLTDISSGNYYAKISNGSQTITKKLLVK